MPWFTSGYPRGGSIPSGSSWCEYRGGLRHATDLHNGLHGANHGAADPRLRPLRVGAGRMKPELVDPHAAAPARLSAGERPSRLYRSLVRNLDRILTLAKARLEAKASHFRCRIARAGRRGACRRVTSIVRCAARRDRVGSLDVPGAVPVKCTDRP